jgi:hypothetical protein
MHIVTWRLKAGIVKSAEESIAKQRIAKRVPERYENTRPLPGSVFGHHGITGVSGTMQTWTAEWNTWKRYLYSVRMKLVQSEIRTARQRIWESSSESYWVAED